MFRFTIQDSVRLPLQAAFRRFVLASTCIVVLAANAVAQTSTQGTPNARSAASQATTTPGQDQAKLPQVNTTVVVHGEIKDDYLPETVTVGTLDGESLQQSPLSATVVTRDILNDQVARVLSDVVKNDASVGEDYAPVGY